VRSFARAPAFSFVALSPDGAIFSYVEQRDERQQVVLRTLRDGSERRVLPIKPTVERIRWCGWASSRYLLCGTVLPMRTEGRIAERTQLYTIDAAQGRARELNYSLKDPLHDQVIDLNVDRRSRVLVQHDPAGLGFPIVSELDVASNQLRTVVQSHPPVRHWMSDGRGEVRLGIGYDAKGTASLWTRRPGGQDWSMYLQQSLSDLDAVGPLAFGSDADDLYVLKHHEGRTGLFRLDLERPPAPELLFADARYDIAGPLIFDPVTHALQGVHYVAERERVHFFSVSPAAEYAWLTEQLPTAINLPGDRSDDGRRMLVHSSSDVDPPSLYLFEVGERELSLLGHQYPELETRSLSPTRAVTYRARDGQPIPAYLTQPTRAGSDLLPAIILPHGGPESRTHLGFDPLVQFLAAEGFTVLQMNFRGSFGYGAGFAAAGVGQWGGVIHNDVTDGARWLVEQGIADPARMCIVGQSFGGYAALLGAARESQWYSCAASYAAPTDLIALSQYMRRAPGAQLWKERLGDDQRALWQMSPVARVAAVETPILLMHGRLDPVVPISQARRFARALRKAGKPHRYVERGDCDHDLIIESCRLAFYEEMQAFLARHLVDAELTH
jgi:dipeptidyl aminopeptidase/acylaminoacyl peptidase